MSITKGFEERESLGNTYYYHEAVDALLAHARALEAMLEKHSISMGGLCRECDKGQWHHAPDCQLAKLLEGVE